MEDNQLRVKSCYVVCVSIHPKTQERVILLGRESSGWYDGLKWTLIGGTLENEETPLECANREFQQETLGILPFIQVGDDATPKIEVVVAHKRLCLLKPNLVREIAFIKLVEWRPYIPYDFARKKLVINENEIKMEKECMELAELRWWSIQDFALLVENAYKGELARPSKLKLMKEVFNFVFKL